MTTPPTSPTPQPSLAPLAHAPPLRQQVYERLEEMIIDGLLAPGQHLVEADLATRLGVSRNPVREALQALGRAEWIELRPRQGAFVHTPTADEVEEFFHVRSVLESESARLAAVNAEDADITRLQELVTDGRAALEDGDEHLLVQINTTFHRSLATIASNRVLASMLHMMEKRLRWYFRPVATVRGATSWDQRAAITEACIAHDGDRAAQIMHAHTSQTADAYSRYQDDQRTAATSESG
ncbi:GntR family transcriptional regulator RoxY [soil metagenome]